MNQKQVLVSFEICFTNRLWKTPESFCTFRYVPDVIRVHPDTEAYLNKLNRMLVDELQASGKLFLSNAVVNEKYRLRACIVNFRTSKKDIEEIVEIIIKEGRRIHSSLA